MQNVSLIISWTKGAGTMSWPMTWETYSLPYLPNLTEFFYLKK